MGLLYLLPETNHGTCVKLHLAPPTWKLREVQANATQFQKNNMI
jgi:hypothetical protein